MSSTVWNALRQLRARLGRAPAATAAGAAVMAVLVTAAPALGTAGAAQKTASPPAAGRWPVAGQNLSNTRYQPDETLIGPGNVSKLRPKWVFQTAPGSGVWATPAEQGGVVYFPDSAGYLYAVDAATGHQIWSDYLPHLSPQLPATATSRTTPVIYGDELIIGDQIPNASTGNGAHLLAVNRFTGALLWITTIESHPAARVTGSPVVYGNTAYVGTSSSEESLTRVPGYPCCTFRGSVVAVNALTGRMLWRTYIIPPNGGQPGGYSGNAVWGSTLVPDPRTGLLYAGTGNNYTVPPGVCATPGQTGCTPPAAGDYEDSVLGMDLRTGAIRWADRMEPADAFPVPGGPDFDFGSGPNLFTATVAGRPRRLLGAGQKSGIYWALDPATGKLIWRTQVGPGGTLGGIEWGSATDGRRIYAAISDNSHLAYTLQGSGPYAGQTVSSGSWSALDAGTGKIEWQTPDPQGAIDQGFVSTANGVVYAGSDAATGNNMYALDAATGQIRWQFASGGSVNSGAAILNGVLFWGSGYHIGAENNKLYAFGLP
jgi:polyvinyl alcohol dehydrogenase (cytochrome)